MSQHKSRSNHWLSLFDFFGGFIKSFFQVTMLFIRGSKDPTSRLEILENHFFKSMHYLFRVAPRKFWQFPTGIGIGRFFGALFVYCFWGRKYISKASTNTKGFTLIEMLVSLTLISIILIAAFAAFGNIGTLKNRIIGEVNLYEELYTASESIVDLIKKSGGIDYEEYFGRRMVGMTLSGGYYITPTGFGNYGNGGLPGTSAFGSPQYLCRSAIGASDKMRWDGCYATGSLNTIGSSQVWEPQRFGQYALQFTDFNKFGAESCVAPAINIPWDQDCNGNIVWDDDDEDLGIGPRALSGSTFNELYLLRGIKWNPERRIFRVLIERDPFAPPVTSPNGICDTQTWVGPACLGRLQMLKLVGKDLWVNHNGTGSGAYDGTIDTWECARDYTCNVLGTALGGFMPSGAASEWVNLLSDNLSVRSLEFTPSPTLDSRLSWKDPGNLLQNQSVRIRLVLGYSWKQTRLTKGNPPSIAIQTSINLAP